MIALRQTRQFEKAYKKLRPNQKTVADKAIRAIASDPELGERKKGDLAHVRVYKFSMLGGLTLLGYSYDEDDLLILLLAVGGHENFYRDLKK